ncbi:MAG: M23 family metallopeptidase [Dysgonamonadaceae bacterium]|jgi:murein DD-endopeptidase MepM/ murein hydrolase activator NlpD|nr:M23 family metallopeptidase [Dysgonamonadaceae bacterium]
MHIKTGEIFAIFITCCISSHAQFHTLLPKDKAKQRETERIVAYSQNIAVNEIDSAQPVNANPALNKNMRFLLDGMRKRLYLSLPVDEIKVNSPYGYRADPVTGKRKFHKGVDLNADFNCVYSIMPGRVIKSGRNRTLGEFIQVGHGEFRTTYGHLLQRFAMAKEAVEAGQAIGISGSSGRSTGEHLHFEITCDGNSIDPMPILNYILQITMEARSELEDVTTDGNPKKQ